MSYQPRIVVVGAGIIGLSTAYALLKGGRQKVTVLEQAAVDHKQGSSHGFSRLLRFEYGADRLYSEMVRLSLRRWQELEQKTGASLYTPTGVLVLGNQQDGFTQQAYTLLRESGVPVRQLSKQQCQQRFPQFNTEEYDYFTYNSLGGILHASTCLRQLRTLLSERGAVIRENCRVIKIDESRPGHPLRLGLSSGEILEADRVVLAVGGWVHKLLPEFRLPIRLTRQYLLYFAGLPTSMYQSEIFPSFLARDLYGFPIHAGCNGWLKVSSHTFGPPVEPDEKARVDEQAIAHTQQQILELLPDLSRATLARIDSCMYDVTPDEHFILDRLPAEPRIIIAAGLSGHAFKFGPLLGEMLGALVCDTKPPVPMERFRLTRFPQTVKQLVHSAA
ncbi:MAG TPA: N-methyl-L-tryptophan oxidase [Ktedonobacteraceae bacterium]|jgi:monomeric sarcosine oxidase|nr:N-methyl-L-tryptophan oxidase [Ktedonobacteraceae bacterium]